MLFEDEVYKKISGFYKEKDGHYQPKKAEISVRCMNTVKDEKICDVKIDLASYINRGPVKDSI